MHSYNHIISSAYNNRAGLAGLLKRPVPGLLPGTFCKLLREGNIAHVTQETGSKSATARPSSPRLPLPIAAPACSRPVSASPSLHSRILVFLARWRRDPSQFQRLSHLQSSGPVGPESLPAASHQRVQATLTVPAGHEVDRIVRRIPLFSV